MKRAVLFIFFLLVVSSVHAVDYPKIVPYVNDFADVLSPDGEAMLNGFAAEIEKNTTVQIVVVILPDTQGDDRLNFANRVGENSGVGDKDTDNGVVILYSLNDEKGGAIATGRGIESILNDAKVARIGRTYKEAFDSGDYVVGFYGIMRDISEELKGIDTSVQDEYQEPSVPIFIIIPAAILLGFFVGAFKLKNGIPSFLGVSVVWAFIELFVMLFIRSFPLTVFIGFIAFLTFHGIVIIGGNQNFKSGRRGIGGFAGGGFSGGGFSGGGGFGGGSFGGGGGKF